MCGTNQIEEVYQIIKVIKIYIYIRYNAKLNEARKCAAIDEYESNRITIMVKYTGIATITTKKPQRK